MNFAFDQDQLMMRDAARKLLDDLSPMSAVHKIMDSEESYDAKLWQAMAENGWLGTAIPESYGGSDLGYLELAVLAEEIGRHCASVPFSSSIYLAAELIKAAGTEEQKHKYLPKLAAGEQIATVALAEQGRTDLDGVTAKVEDGRLHGEKSPVVDGLCADLLILPARERGELSLYLVDLGQGVERNALHSMDRTRKQARLRFDGAAAERLGGSGEAGRHLDAAYDRGAALLAFEQVGLAQAALDMGVAYAKERYAFGRPIGSFQAIKHRLADMFVKLESARSNAYYAAWALAKSPDELPAAAAYARLAANEAAAFATEENVQIHGGIGFTWEADPHMLVKRAKHLESWLGSGLVWGERLLGNAA